MKQIKTIMAVVIALVAFLWISTATVNRLYLNEHGALRGKIESDHARINGYRKSLESSARIEAKIENFIEQTLGGDMETVDHRLRTRLNRVREQVGLQKATVGTGKPAEKKTPAKSLFKGSRYRALREQPDFVEVEAWVSGEGTFAQAVELIDRIRAEPWIKRITRVKLDPKANADRFSITVRLVTLFLPGRTPTPSESTPAYDRTRLDQYAALIAGNPFLLPPPPAPAVLATVQPQAPPPPPPPKFPYGQWVLTGVAENSAGVEAWLLNQKSGETRLLSVSERIHEVVLLATREDAAEFELDGKRFLVSVGYTLQDRKPLKQ